MPHLTRRSFNIGMLSGALGVLLQSVVRASSMQIFVKTFTGETIPMEVEPSTTVSALKRRLSRRTKHKVTDFTLYYGQRELEDSKTLAESGITKGATIELKKRE